MNKVIALFALTILFSFNQPPQILKEVNLRLQNLSKIQYTSSFEQKIYDMPSDNWSSTGSMAFDFSEANALGSKIKATRVDRKPFRKIYKNEVLFNIRPKTQTLVIDTLRNPAILYGQLSLYFSLFELREVIPKILEDTTSRVIAIKDTVINDQAAFQIHLELEKMVFMGNLTEGENKKNRYLLSVRKEDYLPIEWKVILKNGFVKTSYTDIVLLNLPESTWQLSEAEQAYMFLSGSEYRNREKNKLNQHVGKSLPDWQLSTIEGKILSKDQFKGKLTLYEFFFVGCPGSVKIKSFMDELRKTYATKGLEIVSIETQNYPKEAVKSFLDKYELKGATCYNGKDLAAQLGIAGCPTFILVNQVGNIEYASFGNTQGLMRLINVHLQK